MAVWSELSEEQQREALDRVFRGENKYDVAEAYGLKETSFARKLRYLREIGEIDDSSIAEQPDTPTLPQTTFTEDGNEAALEWSGGSPICTLDELIEAHKIDLDEWQQYGQVVHNTWTTPRAKRGADGFEYFQNHQVKANFIKIHPVPIFPVISPIDLNVEFAYPAPPKTEGVGLSFVIADPHFGYRKDLKTAHLEPFHDRRVLSVCLQLIHALQPDRIDILGDWLDMSEWTDKFMRDPEFYWTTQPALLESSWWLAQIREFAPEAQITLHQGNHEARLDAALKTHLPAAYDLKAVDELDLPPALSVPKLLALHKLGVSWRGDYPDDGEWITPRLALEHGDRALSPGNTAKHIAQHSQETHIFGHIHRQEMVSKTVHGFEGGFPITAFCPGCACHIDGRVPGSDSKTQWQNGAALVEYEIGGMSSNITPIFIDRGRAIFRGSVYTGEDRVEDIRASMDGWNI